MLQTNNKKSYKKVIRYGAFLDLALGLIFLTIFLVGCDKQGLPSPNITSKSPLACSKVLSYTLKKFPVRDTTDTKLLHMVANDYREIQHILTLAKICAKHDLMASTMLNDKPNTVGSYYNTVPIEIFPVRIKRDIHTAFFVRLRKQVRYIRYIAISYKDVLTTQPFTYDTLFSEN